MSTNNKVLWGEGLFLRPQHFQQLDRYHESRLNEMAKILQPYSWGVQRVEIDQDALKSNMLRLLDIALVFPDGEIVKAPSHDTLPESVDLTETPLTQQEVVFYISLPSLKGFGENFSQNQNDSQSYRYTQANRDTPDLYTQAVSAELTYLKKSLRLVSELEPRDAYDSVAIVRLRRLATGGFELDEQFIPPSLTIASTPELPLQLRRLLDALQAKVNALYGHHREPSKNIIEFRSGDVSSFWLLHTASSSFATLSHYLHHPDLHPERLFEQLLGLAGALLTYAKESTLADLPKYEHDNMGECFHQLFSLIRELLDTVISAKYFSIALSEVKPSYHQGTLDSGKITQDTTLYIAVSANIPATELVELVPVQFKVGAPDDVDKLVLSAMPGVKLVHAPQVPAAIPVRPNTLYFALEKNDKLYNRMMKSQTASIYVPTGINDLKLNLMAVSS